MGIARDISKIFSTSTSLATDSEISSSYLTLASASSTYRTILSDQTAFKNLIINGAMQVAQRGTSASSLNDTNTSYHTADRWRGGNIGPLGTWTQSVENDAPTGSGFSKSLKMLVTTADASPAAGDLMLINQRFEGQNLQQIAKGTSSAKQLTLSFWVKSNVTGTYIVELSDEDNTRHVSASYTISASATWEKKTITFPADTTGAFDNDNALSLRVNWWLGAGTTYTSGTLPNSWNSTTSANRAVGQTNVAAATNNYWQITGVQLEVGNVATDYEFKPIDVELAQCQRYYFRISAGTYNNAGLTLCVGNGGSAPGVRRLCVPLPVAMRARPNITKAGTHYLYTSGLTNRGFNTINGNYSTNTIISLDVNTTNTTSAGEPLMYILDSSSANDYLEAESEL